MLLSHKENSFFDPILNHVKATFNNVICSGASTLIIHQDSIVLERYIGKQSGKEDARTVQPDTEFHVASVSEEKLQWFCGFLCRTMDI